MYLIIGTNHKCEQIHRSPWLITIHLCVIRSHSLGLILWGSKMSEKKCKACDIIKDLDSFWKNKAAKDGHSGYCKECEGAQNKQRYKDNPEYHAKRRHKYYQLNKKDI